MQSTARDEPQSRSETKAVTRQKLMDSARDVFLKLGYQGATLEDIAARAGFTKGAVYWHFPNKRAVFLALVADAISANLSRLDSMMEDDLTPEQFEDRFGAWIDRIDDDEELPLYGVELEIESRRDPEFRKIYSSMIEQHEHALSNYLSRYFMLVQREPLMPIDELSTTLVTLIKAFALTRQNRQHMPLTSSKPVRILLGMPV